MAFSDLEIPIDIKNKAEIIIMDDVLILTYWKWDYAEALSFQKLAQDYIRYNKKHKIYIFCNHPHCLTNGRGNERGNDSLISFDASGLNLRYQVHDIHRGGGVTFHYPGQWIFYPIVSISQSLSLNDLMCWILKSVSDVLSNDLGLSNVLATTKLVGVWKDKQKLASIGIGMSHFVTEHGLALNLVYDDDMFQELPKINPCGLKPTTYQSVDQFLDNGQRDNLIDNFHQFFINRLSLN
jgi:lipoyl(octanoyl) transferase